MLDKWKLLIFISHSVFAGEFLKVTTPKNCQQHIQQKKKNSEKKECTRKLNDASNQITPIIIYI